MKHWTHDELLNRWSYGTKFQRVPSSQRLECFIKSARGSEISLTGRQTDPVVILFLNLMDRLVIITFHISVTKTLQEATSWVGGGTYFSSWLDTICPSWKTWQWEWACIWFSPSHILIEEEAEIKRLKSNHTQQTYLFPTQLPPAENEDKSIEGMVYIIPLKPKFIFFFKLEQSQPKQENFFFD